MGRINEYTPLEPSNITDGDLILATNVETGETVNILVGDLFNTRGNLTEDQIAKLNYNGENYITIPSDFDFQSIPTRYDNSTWLITNNHDLLTNSITLPTNVTLMFLGGSFTNGTIIGLNTKIIASETEIFSTSITLTGSWEVKESNPLWFGATGDGVADDVVSLEKTINFGGNINLLGNSYLTSRAITNSSNFSLSNGTITNTQPNLTGLIVNTSSIAEIKDMTIRGNAPLIRQNSSFTKLVLDTVNYTGTANTLTNFLLSTQSNIQGVSVSINNNRVQSGNLLFADDISLDLLDINNNYVNQPQRFVVRSLEQGSGRHITNINFNSNVVNDMNGDLVDKSNVARCVQVAVDGVLNAHNNVLDRGESTAISNFIYLDQGSLNCTGNTIKNIKSTTIGAIIDDKTMGDPSRFWYIGGNTFDFTNTTLAESPEAMVRINEGQNVKVQGNLFRGLKCIAVRVYNSQDNNRPAQNISIDNNDVRDMEYPIAFQVFQDISNVDITNNNVYNITNPTNLNVNNRTQPRVVDIYITFNNGNNLENVTVRGNMLDTTASNAFMTTIYRNAVALTSDILNVSILYNEIRTNTGGGFILWTLGNTITGNIDLIGNTGKTGTVLTLGASAPNLRSANNIIT